MSPCDTISIFDRVAIIVQLWDLGTGRLAETIPWARDSGGEPCLLYAAQFSRDPQVCIHKMHAQSVNLFII